MKPEAETEAEAEDKKTEHIESQNQMRVGIALPAGKKRCENQQEHCHVATRSCNHTKTL